MDGAGSLENFAYPVRRRIPDNFKHLLERRSFRHFNWAGYGWDLTPEEQLSLKHGEVPPATYADLSLLSHLNDQWALRTFDQREARGAPEALATAQAASQTTLSDVLPADVGLLPAADPSPCTFHSTTLPSIHSRSSPSMVFNPQELSMLPGKDDWGSLLVSPAIVGPCIDTRLLMTTPEAQIASTLPDFEIDTVSEGTENSERLPPTYSPNSAPALSPSGSSTCSSEDFDLNTELFPGPLSHHRSQSTAPQEKSDSALTIDPRLLLQFPAVEGISAPEPFIVQRSITPMPSHVSAFGINAESLATASSTVPMISQTTELSTLCAPVCLPALPPSRSKPKSGSTAGSSRSTGSRASRGAKPYRLEDSPPTTKRQSSRGKQLRAENSGFKGYKVYGCPGCEYVQNPGASAKRSFKRHLDIHYKTVVWRCKGIPQRDGTYAGGCGKVFSRRDALLRHIKNTGTGCISVCEPDGVPVEYDFDAMVIRKADP